MLLKVLQYFFFAAAIPSSLGEWLNYIRFSPHFLKLVGHVNYQPMALSSNSSTPPANLLLTRVFIVAYEQFIIGFDAWTTSCDSLRFFYINRHFHCQLLFKCRSFRVFAFIRNHTEDQNLMPLYGIRILHNLSNQINFVVRSVILEELS